MAAAAPPRPPPPSRTANAAATANAAWHFLRLSKQPQRMEAFAIELCSIKSKKKDCCRTESLRGPTKEEAAATCVHNRKESLHECPSLATQRTRNAFFFFKKKGEEQNKENLGLLRWRSEISVIVVQIIVDRRLDRRLCPPLLDPRTEQSLTSKWRPKGIRRSLVPRSYLTSFLVKRAGQTNEREPIAILQVMNSKTKTFFRGRNSAKVAPCQER